MFALIAGTGALPRIVVDRLAARGIVPLVCTVAGVVPDLPEGLPRLEFGLETLGSFLETLVRLGVTEVCLAGAVSRPRLDPARLDAATRPLVPRIMAAMAKGDDGALRELLALITERGMAVVAATDLAPDLLPAAGCLTKAQPGAAHAADALRAEAEIAAMGRADTGQACVVKAAAVVAREDAAGTDAMLARLARPAPIRRGGADPLFAPLDAIGDLIGGAADWLSGADGPGGLPGAGGILFKAPKPAQDRRVDLPAIGPETAAGAAKAGLAGIVIEAGGVMVLDLTATIAALDARGLFLWVRPATWAVTP